MAQPGPAPQPDVSLQQRVAELEKINAEFLRAQQQLEQEFNQKRAKFKELYLAKEEDLKRQMQYCKLHRTIWVTFGHSCGRLRQRWRTLRQLPQSLRILSKKL